MSLYNELKRRNVFRVAIAYLAGAWLLTEVAGTLFPVFGIPDWGIRFMVIVFALGFVPALIISWAYELTPEGLKREQDVVRDASITHLTAKRLDGITIGLIVVALAFLLADRFWLSPRHTEQSASLTEVVTDTVQTLEPEPQYPPNSIAVLPFANRSANPDDAYFVDGIHDDLLTHISKIGSIKTSARTSVMQFRDSTKSIPEIAAELGVATVLEGGVQRAGEQVRINVQLIDALTDEHLWAEIYDRQLSATNIFSIQTEIAEAIAKALQTTLSPTEQHRLRAVPTENLAAYEAYLIGRLRLAQRRSDSLAEAVDYFTAAVEIDSQFALAWASLGDTYLIQRLSTNEDDLFIKAKAAIDRALTLDPQLGEAYASLGKLQSYLDDNEAAEKSYRRAIELAPNYTTTYHWYSIFLRDQGRYEEAAEMIATAVQLDPMSPIIRQHLAVNFRTQGRNQEALEELEKAILIDPDFSRAHDAIATIEWQVFNRFPKAAQSFVKAIELDPNNPSGYTYLGQLFLDLGATGRATELFSHSRDLAPRSFGAIWGGLLLQVFHGDKENITDDAANTLELVGTGSWLGQFAAAQLRNSAIATNQHAQALEVYSESYPQLLEEGYSNIGLHNYRAAIDLALVLQLNGEREKANDLLNLCQEFIGGQPRLGWWGGYWVSDVQILALQGKNQEAIAALQQAADDGWRSLWWYYLQYDPNLNSIRSEPEFQIVVAEIQADMASQMQRIREMEQGGEIGPVPGVVIEPK